MHKPTFTKKYIRNTVIIVFTIILLATILGVIIASFQGAQYRKDYTNWEKLVSSYAVKNNNLSFSKLMIIGRLETEEETASQKKDCNANTERLTKLTDIKHPELPFNLFGALSGSYRESKNMNNETNSKEKTTRQAISDMNDYKDLCSYYVKSLDIAKKEIAQTQSAKQYKVYEGTDQQQQQSCAIDGCLPKDKALWPKLADIYQAYVTSSKSYAKLYKEECFSSIYKKVCELNAKYHNDEASIQQRYNDAIRKGSAFYAGFSTRLEKKYNPLLEKAYADVRTEGIPEYKDSESTIQKSLMQRIEKKIDANLKALAQN